MPPSATEEPLVSVIVLTWNRCDFLFEALESVRSQSHKNVEVLVIDDGSDDETADRISSRPPLPVRYLPMPHTGHIAKLRNVGLAHATGEYLCFLDSDDLWCPGKLKEQIDAIAALPSAGFSFCGFQTFDDTGSSRLQTYRRSGEEGRERSARNIFGDLISGSVAVYASSLLIRRRCIDLSGTLDERLRTGDYEFLTRLALLFPAAIVHSLLVRIRKHAGNVSRHIEEHDLREAITTVEGHYERRRIPRSVRDERLLKYRSDLMRNLLLRNDIAAASCELQACQEILTPQEGDGESR